MKTTEIGSDFLIDEDHFGCAIYAPPMAANGTDRRFLKMIDPFKDPLLTFTQAAALFSRKVHPATVNRWAQVGTPSGLKLESVVVGGRRYTTEKAVREFVTAASSTPAAVAV